MKRPFISIVVAKSENNVIGYQNQLPWHLPADLKHFKMLTSGHPIIMGRKTFESIGKPLPNRTNIIVTRDAHFSIANGYVCTSLHDAIKQASQEETEIFIIGGAEIYQQSLSLVNKIYLTIVHAHIVGDTFFPTLDEYVWQETSREYFSADEKNNLPYSFVVLEKK